MAFVAPDPNTFYPIPPGQLPPGFIPPPPGTAVRGIPIVVPLGHEMLISPEGFPVFVPERALVQVNGSPVVLQQQQQQQQHQQHIQATPPPPTPSVPGPPTRNNTMSSQFSGGPPATSQFTPPPPMPPLPTMVSQQLTMPYPVPTGNPPPLPAQHQTSYPAPNHGPPLTHAPPPFPPLMTMPTSVAPPQPQQPAQQPLAAAPALTFASIVTSFRTSSESVQAWTFYSLGLSQHSGQKEIVITLRQRPGQYTLESVQPIMYQLFHQINSHIQSSGGRPLGAGQVFPCRLNTPDVGVLERAVLLIHAPAECKGQLENKDVLYGLIATMEEMAVFSKYGAARCLTNMGNDLETWPVPLWSDWSRQPLVSLQNFEGSLTERVSVLATKNIVATLDTISHRLMLVISASALELIQQDLRRFPPANGPVGGSGFSSDLTRVTFLLDIDAGAQAYLTWRSGQEGPAIFNARPNPTSFHGCWITMSGIGAHEVANIQEGVTPREDGIELKMRAATWERFYQALISRTPAVVPVGAETVQLSYA
ncbi:hypothetical protein KI688_001729 [Linnemannia hyalina]|uniref:Uncharacterized protein n=1 Tax=Linnemannia hyalina TaxID=64524 RepID=A0A9P7XST4_9FUNG|nr:hypothetical protein KI688_001729 [Linnemannia hyalina]